MRYCRLWSDERGESHAELLDPPFRELLQAGVAQFLRFPAGSPGGTWHPAPNRRLVVVLQGALGGAVSDGTEYTLSPGDCAMLEDTTGKGHTTSVMGDEDAILLVVTLPE